MYIRITAENNDIERFCYKPLVQGHIYKATLALLNYSSVNGVEYNTFYDVFFDDQIVVRGVHESRLEELNQDEIRDFKLQQILSKN